MFRRRFPPASLTAVEVTASAFATLQLSYASKPVLQIVGLGGTLALVKCSGPIHAQLIQIVGRRARLNLVATASSKPLYV